ncbi:MAG TPA: ornithine carbamoyltransferase [Acidobacteriota bacterium]|nr:ornithine carbamoyltransferase [Acidobacteriota bacterium]
MPYNIKNQSFLKLLDFSTEEIHFLLNLSEELKKAKYAGTEQPKLKGKNIVLIFEKGSTRTRCAFETAAFDQGANITYLGPTGSQLGTKETIKDTARVLGRMYDGIEYRGFEQARIQELADHSGVPVWNGLTNEFHPTQALADLMTMEEHSKKPLNQVTFAFLGDARYNMGNSLLIAASKMGMDFRSIAPKELQPGEELVLEAKEISRKTGGNILITENIEQGVKNCDFLYSDVWVSMGEPEDEWKKRINLLIPYRVNKKTTKLTNNPNVKFMHCLPAFHNRKTTLGEEIYQKYGVEEMEVSDEVFESEASIVFDEAENRVHTIKAIMVATLS